MEFILYITSWYGIYNLLMNIWQELERMELGYTVVTKVDTVICLLISIVISLVVWLCTEVEEV